MGQYNSEIHHRRSMRLRNYDYSQEGAYFITICTHERIEMFGEIISDGLQVNHKGEIVQEMWDSLPTRFPGTELDAFIVMPNHIHGIIVRTQHIDSDSENNKNNRDHKPEALMSKLEIYRKSSHRYQTLYEMVRTFKAVASYHLRRTGNTPDFRWQREYYDHIIRNAHELDTIRNYILNNPSKWQQDKLHPLSNWPNKQKLLMV